MEINLIKEAFETYNNQMEIIYEQLILNVFKVIISDNFFGQLNFTKWKPNLFFSKKRNSFQNNFTVHFLDSISF